jgi:large subunit ribosomal protein L5
MTATAPTARLKTRYLDEIRPALIERFGYSSVMQAPRLAKITLNMGVGDAKQDSKVLKAAQEQLATIAGQHPSVRRARKSIAAFKLREGMPVGVAVTLRAERGYEFLDRLTSIAIPRIRDFRGLNPRSFDGHGNYSMGVREQIIFPEIDYDSIDQVRGIDITITTTARTDVEAFALLQSLGMPFAVQGRPAGFDGDADTDESTGVDASADTDESAGVEASADTDESTDVDASADTPVSIDADESIDADASTDTSENGSTD